MEINTCLYAQHAHTLAHTQIGSCRIRFAHHLSFTPIFPSWLCTAASNQSNGRLHVTTTGCKRTFWCCPAIYLHRFPPRIPLTGPTGRQPLLHVLESFIILWPHTLSLPAFIHTCVLRFIHVGTKKMLRLTLAALIFLCLKWHTLHMLRMLRSGICLCFSCGLTIYCGWWSDVESSFESSTYVAALDCFFSL